MKDFAIKALGNGISIIPLSIGAFADKAFYDEAMDAAGKSGARILIPSGAVGGFDVLRTISLMAKANGWEITAGIHTHKGPDSLRNTPLYTEELQETEKTVFSGTTAEAIALLPTKVNVLTTRKLRSQACRASSAMIIASLLKQRV